MTSCPFCSDTLLRHIRARQTFWLCRRCRLEIPASESVEVEHCLPPVPFPSACHHAEDAQQDDPAPDYVPVS